MIKLNKKKAAKSIEQWAEMTQLLLDMKAELIRSKHPEWSEKKVYAEINRQVEVLRKKTLSKSDAAP